mmetsp:Transcript_8098/g.21661  ORF Transcript_8098/g.21661 Transcript_8098/m.21661 type:complete len:235 (-) Transcript_8098:401-1105(-)
MESRSAMVARMFHEGDTMCVRWCGGVVLRKWSPARRWSSEREGARRRGRSSKGRARSGGGGVRDRRQVQQTGDRDRLARRRRRRRRRSRGRCGGRLRRCQWGPRSLFLLQAARVGRVPRLRLAARTCARLLQRPRVGRVARLGRLARRVEERVDAAEAALLRDGRRRRVPPVQSLLTRAGQELLLGPREGLVLAPRGRRRLAPRRDVLKPGRVEGVEERIVVGRRLERCRRPGF